jgi:hypothetical protein
VAERARFMQGTMLQMGLVFQVASGYLLPNTPEFQESWRLASELKGFHKTLSKANKLKSA